MLKQWVVACSIFFTCSVSAEKFSTDDVVLDYKVSGNGSPLLILHGGGSSKESMKKYVDFFDDNYQVIALDSREQGASSISDKPISYDLMVKDTLALIEHLGLNKVNIIGYSDGAIIGLLLAMQAPEKVGKVAAIAANYHWNISDQFVAEIEAMKKEMLSIPIEKMPESYKQAFIRWGKKPEDAYVLYRELFDMWMTSPEIPLSSFKTITADIMYLVGDRDMISVEHTTEMFRNTPGSQLFIVPNATHGVIAEKTDMLTSAIAEFLAPEVSP